MKYFSEKTKNVTVKKEQEVAYLKCDICHRKIENKGIGSNEQAKYFLVCTSHNDWGNDSIESIKYKDICPQCISDFCSNYLKEAKGTEEIEIETKWFVPYYDEYDENEDRLVSKDK